MWLEKSSDVLNHWITEFFVLWAICCDKSKLTVFNECATKELWIIARYMRQILVWRVKLEEVAYVNKNRALKKSIDHRRTPWKRSSQSLKEGIWRVNTLVTSVVNIREKNVVKSTVDSSEASSIIVYFKFEILLIYLIVYREIAHCHHSSLNL